MSTQFSGPQEWKSKGAHHINASVIHRYIAFFYGGIAAIATIIILIAWTGTTFNSNMLPTFILPIVIGVIAGIHLSISKGAERRNGIAKAASIFTGLLLILGFPIGTIVGVLILRASLGSWSEQGQTIE